MAKSEQFYYYFIAPLANSAKCTNGRYSDVKDASSRSLVSEVNLKEIYVKASYRLLKVSSKYVEKVTSTWGFDMSKAAILNALPDSTIMNSEDRLVVMPEDLDNKIVSFVPVHIGKTLLEEMNKYNEVFIITPDFSPTTDYSTLTKDERVVYFIPLFINDPNYVESVIMNGVAVSMRLKAQWLEKLIVKPYNEWGYIKEDGEVITLKDNLSIALMPIGVATPPFDVTIIQMVMHNMFMYIYEATGRDMLKEISEYKADQEWASKLAEVYTNGNIDDEIDKYNRQLSQVESDYHKLSSNMREALGTRKAIEASISAGDVSPDNVIKQKALRSLGCYIDGNKVVMPLNGVKLEHDGKMFMIGDLLVDIIVDRASSMQLKVRRNPSSKVYNESTRNPHPHVDTDGNLCLGDVREEANKCIKMGDMCSLLMWVSHILMIYNAASPHADVSYWPECDKDGNIVAAPTRAERS